MLREYAGLVTESGSGSRFPGPEEQEEEEEKAEDEEGVRYAFPLGTGWICSGGLCVNGFYCRKAESRKDLASICLGEMKQLRTVVFSAE